MKINLGKRIILFLHWLFSVAACVIATIYCIKPDLMWNTFETVYGKIGKRQTDIIGAACLAIYVVLSVATVIIIVSNKEKREQRSFIVVDSSESGRTRIAVSAVEQMIRQSVRGIDEIKTMKTSIKNNGDSIEIDSDVIIAESAHIPSVTSAIQRSVRSYIELNCGVSVKSICVNVRAVEQTAQKGKRGAKAAERNYSPITAPEIKMPETVHAEPEKSIITEPAYADAPADDLNTENIANEIADQNAPVSETAEDETDFY